MNTAASRILIFAFFSLCTCLWAQDEDERVYVASCSLYVKTTPYTPDPENISGSAMVEATLCDKSGIPIPDQEITMTATCGTLSCPPTGTSITGGSVPPERACFITGRDGRIAVFLSDIPFNKPGRVRASCTYSDIKVHASSSFSIIRKIIKKGSRKKSSSQTRASSVK